MSSSKLNMSDCSFLATVVMQSLELIMNQAIMKKYFF